MRFIDTRIINRDEEQKRLLKLADCADRRMAMVSGRRRIGTTFLLTRMWGELPFFYFTAANTTGLANRRQLVLDYARFSEQTLDVADYPTWRMVFKELLGGPQPRIIVLDEFQYLANDADGLKEVTSELNAVWEQPNPLPCLLILSGSALTTMQALAAGGSPLYGRFNYHTVLKSFDHYHALQLVGVEDLRTAVAIHACFGGTPRYLATYDNRLSFRENVIHLLLSPHGEVRHLVETALDQEEGLRDVGSYRAILDAVASGLTERNAIAQRAGLTNDVGLRRRLDKLVQLGYLTSGQNFGAKRNGPVRYRLDDFAFRFQSYFVAKNRSQLDRLVSDAVYDSVVAPMLDTYIGKVFEQIALEAITQLAGKHNLPVLAELGNWEGMDRDRTSVEIDIVGRTFQGEVVTGEVKWNRKPVGTSLHEQHLAKLQALARSGQGWAEEATAPGAQHVYVSAAGFTSEWSDVEDVITLDLQTLYETK